MASWNAGAGFQTSVSNLSGMSTFLEKIKQWETARNIGAFTEYQKAVMRSLNTLLDVECCYPRNKVELAANNQ